MWHNKRFIGDVMQGKMREVWGATIIQATYKSRQCRIDAKLIKSITITTMKIFYRLI